MMGRRDSAGFSLIEIMVALSVVTVGVLAIGKFSLSTLAGGQVSRERLTAVHLAEQIIEEWQKSDQLPALSGYCSNAGAAWNPQSPQPQSMASCTPNFGTKVPFTITVIESALKGPPPTGGTFMTYKGSSKNPMTRYVGVNWTHHGAHQVYLTHVSRWP